MLKLIAGEDIMPGMIMTRAGEPAIDASGATYEIVAMRTGDGPESWIGTAARIIRKGEELTYVCGGNTDDILDRPNFTFETRG